MEQVKIGIIGGSGLYQMPELTDVTEVEVETPFGKPSDAFIIGTLMGERVAFLPRHGRGHKLTPTELPFRANIYAMKLLGVDYILSVSAVGSLREDYAPTDFCIPDQFFDRTRARAEESTFFGNGIVGHITFAHPVCAELGDILEASCKTVEDLKVHRGGTYICMEGPAFSTLAESNVYRSWGMDIIGMTNLQEAKLAREAEIAYATVALVTDYDRHGRRISDEKRAQRAARLKGSRQTRGGEENAESVCGRDPKRDLYRARSLEPGNREKTRCDHRKIRRFIKITIVKIRLV
jgi:5'-methylthioadenosine phosphorylase